VEILSDSVDCIVEHLSPLEVDRIVGDADESPLAGLFYPPDDPTTEKPISHTTLILSVSYSIKETNL
jgi:hypothetical protein